MIEKGPLALWICVFRDGGANWQLQTSGTQSSLQAICDIGKELWAVGDRGTILHSGDGGANWQPLSSGTQSGLRAICGSGKELWAVGDSNLLLHGEISNAYPFVRQARLLGGVTNVRLEFEVEYPGGDPASQNIEPRLFGANDNTPRVTRCRCSTWPAEATRTHGGDLLRSIGATETLWRRQLDSHFLDALDEKLFSPIEGRMQAGGMGQCQGRVYRPIRTTSTRLSRASTALIGVPRWEERQTVLPIPTGAPVP